MKKSNDSKIVKIEDYQYNPTKFDILLEKVENSGRKKKVKLTFIVLIPLSIISALLSLFFPIFWIQLLATAFAIAVGGSFCFIFSKRPWIDKILLFYLVVILVWIVISNYAVDLI